MALQASNIDNNISRALSQVAVLYIYDILHSPVYTFFEKVCIVELNADVETGNSKFEIR